MSNEHLTPDLPPVQDKDWEATMHSFVENNESRRNPTAPPKNLRRRTFTVVLSSVAVVLLSVILLIVMLPSSTPQEDTDGSASSNSQAETKPSIPLLDKTGNSTSNSTATYVQEVSFSNNNESFTISYNAEEKVYVLKGYEDLSLSLDMVLSLRKFTEKIQALEQVSNASNLAAFGLDKPQATATITYTDHTSTSIRIGAVTPSKNGYYGQFGDSNEVYIFSSDSGALFCSRAASFIDTLLIATPEVKSDDKNGLALLRNATYTGKSFATPVTLRRTNHLDNEVFSYFSYLISDPYLRAVNDVTANALGQFKSLSAEQALLLHPTAKQKSALGFDTPLLQLKLTMSVETEEDTDSDNPPKKYYNTVDYILTVGSVNADGNYVVMRDGIDAIFLVSKEKFSYLFDLTYENAVNEFLFIRQIESIGRIVIRLDNNTEYDFKLTHYPKEEKANDQLRVTSGDKVYSTEHFRKLYELMLNLRRYDSKPEKPSGEVPLEITLYDNDGLVYLSAKYYNTSGSLCTVETTVERHILLYSPGGKLYQRQRRSRQYLMQNKKLVSVKTETSFLLYARLNKGTSQVKNHVANIKSSGSGKVNAPFKAQSNTQINPSKAAIV